MKIITRKLSFFSRLTPKLIVFDLDETLWPFGIDDYVMKPPYKKITAPDGMGSQVVDAEGKHMFPYPEVNDVLKKIHSSHILMAAASRTTFPEGAESLIELFGWKYYFKYKEMYPGSKVEHLKHLMMKSQIEFKDMLFFDNELRNIVDVDKLGVICQLVDSETGLDTKTFKLGMGNWMLNKNRSRYKWDDN